MKKGIEEYTNIHKKIRNLKLNLDKLQSYDEVIKVNNEIRKLTREAEELLLQIKKKSKQCNYSIVKEKETCGIK